MITLLLTAQALAQTAPAQTAPPQDSTATVSGSGSTDSGFVSQLSTDGELRLIGSMYPSDTVLDTDGTTLGQGAVLDSRLRAGLDWRPDSWRVGVEFDFFDGQLAGDVWDIQTGEDARNRHELSATGNDIVELRRAAVEGRIGSVGLQAGLVTSHWGLGMLANDGAHDPVFGRNDFGDRVLRVRAATRPFDGGELPLTFVLAGDRVIEDDTAEWSPFNGGQATWQGIASAVWSDQETVGLYGVWRHQTEVDGERVTEVGVIDLYADAPVALGDWTLKLAIEAAAITGRTDRVQSYNAREGLEVKSGGITGQASVAPAEERVSAMLRAGWASGDGDPDDDTTSDFTFDRDFDVGMVLFDELMGAVEANTYVQLNDPSNSGGAPEGAEALVTEGAFRRATFVQPVIGARPMDWLAVKAGVTMSWGTAPVGQSYYSYRNGGVPANHLAQPTSGYALGTEIDWAVKLGDVGLGDSGALEELKPALLLQGGHLLASSNLGGETITLLTATGRVRW